MTSTVTTKSTPQTRNKLVVRRLPPTLPEDIFWRSVSEWITDKTCLWKRYVKGHAGDDLGGHPIHSRAYCLMADTDGLIAFHKGFDGHVFRSKSGVEYQTVVEFSPMQKTPFKTKVKTDARQGTIDDDPDYLSFLESLSAPPTKPVLEVSAPITQPTSTPLLDHLRLHGAGRGSKSKSKGQSSSSSTETARRSAALASISAAAAKRSPNATVPGPSGGNGVVMVAGKGREVTITPTTSLGSTTSGELDTNTKSEAKGKGKGRGRGKGKSNAAERTPSGEPSPTSNEMKNANTGRGIAAGGNMSLHGSSLLSQTSSVASMGSNGAGTSGQAVSPSGPTSRGRGGKGRGGRPDGVARETEPSTVKSTGGPPRTSPADGGVQILQRDNSPEANRGNRNLGETEGRGSGRGGRGGRGKDKTARGTVLEILRNTDVARGGREGRGRGRRAAPTGSPEAAARVPRIDGQE